MEKIQYNLVKGNYHPRLFCNCETSNIYVLSDGRMLKVLKSWYLDICSSMVVDLEGKVCVADKMTMDSAIIIPEVVVYDGSRFIGFIMQHAKGISASIWDNNLTISQRRDLFLYADFYSKLEKIVRSSEDIVYPDLCTCDNIYVNAKGSDIFDLQLGDYDGLQVGRYPSASISSSLGCSSQYITSKKYFDNNLFKKELDKKSLIMLYFLFTFSVDLNKVGMINPFDGKRVTLDDFFGVIGLDDWDVMDKVWRIFHDNKENEYLGDDVFRIAENYTMNVEPNPFQKGYFKELVPKR